MIDLQAKINLTSNVAALAKDIQDTLAKVKGKISPIGSTALKNLQDYRDQLKNVAKGFQQLEAHSKNIHVFLEKSAQLFAKNTGGLSKLNNTINGNTKAQKASTAATAKNLTVLQQFGHQAALATKRYTAFTIAIGLGFGALSAAKNAIKDAIVFQDKLVKMTQITGKSFLSLRPLSNEITRLSTSLGVSSEKLQDVSLILLQAGYSSRDTKKALDALAKVDLSPSFGDIHKATEAAIAIISQFGGSVDDLQDHFDAINKVSAEFAVEAQDIVVAVQRAGAAFGQLTKSQNNPKQAMREFIALFTAVRSTTREGAETIATGLRTIFTRLQRPQTIEFFKSLHIELEDVNKQFIGLYPAIQRIGEGIKGLSPLDPRMAQLSEELGGFRQINKTIPLITQLERTTDALSVAMDSAGFSQEQVAKSTESLLVQVSKLKEEFLALFRAISEESTFRVLVGSLIKAAQGLNIALNAIRPLLPILGAVAAIKGIKATAIFGGAFVKSIQGKLGKGAGGVIPGTGNTDSVHAMLTPGEFVINKASATKIGYSNLSKINKYAAGGPVMPGRKAYGGILGGLGGLGAASTESANIDTNTVRAIMAFDQALEHLTGAAKDVAAGFKVVRDESIKRGPGQFTRSSGIAAFKKGATMGTVGHEAGHALEVAIAESLGMKQLPSQIEGSYASQVAQEFKGQRYRESLKEGVGRRRMQHRLKPAELFAEAYGRMTPEQQRIATFRMQNDPTVRGADPFSALSYYGGSGGVLPTTGSVHTRHTGIPTQFLPLPTPPRATGRNWRSSVLRAGQKYGGRFGARIGAGLTGLGANPMTLAIGAAGAGAAFGNVDEPGFFSSTNKKTQRGIGVAGESITGALGGAGVGAMTGNPYAIAGGAVVGFVMALNQAQEKVRHLNFSDALEEGIEAIRQKKTPDFAKIAQERELASNPSLYERATEEFSFGYNFKTGLYEGGDIEKVKRQKAAQFASEHSTEIEEILKPSFQQAAKGKTFSEFLNSKEGSAAYRELINQRPDLVGNNEKLNAYARRIGGFGEGGLNFTDLSDELYTTTLQFQDLAEALRSADVATKGFSQAVELAESRAAGKAGVAHFNDYSELIRNPNSQTLGNTFGALRDLKSMGVPVKMGEVGLAAYVQGNFGDISRRIYEGKRNVGGTSSPVSDIIGEYTKSFTGGVGRKFGDVGNMPNQIIAALEGQIAHGNERSQTFEEFKQNMEKGMKPLLGAFADISKEVTEQGNKFIDSMAKLAEAGVAIEHRGYERMALGVEQFNKGLEFKGLTSGSRSTLSSFQIMQEGIGARAGLTPEQAMNPEFIGKRMRQIEGIQTAHQRGQTALSFEELAGLNNELITLEGALESLTRATEQNTSIEKQLAEINANRGERVNLARRFMGGSPHERAEMVQGLNLVNAFRGGQLPKNLSPENFKLMDEMVGQLAHIVPDLQHNWEEHLLNTMGVQLPDNRKQMLQNQVMGNFDVAKRAMGVQQGLQQGGLEQGVQLATEKLNTVLSTIFGSFADKFEKIANQMPREIQLVGRHDVNVNVQGLAFLEGPMKDFIEAKVGEGVEKLARKLRAAPPNGPGINV